jgi:hypothetical protein
LKKFPNYVGRTPVPVIIQPPEGFAEIPSVFIIKPKRVAAGPIAEQYPK